MVGDRFIEGMIKEKQEAKQIYEQAKAEGKKAALVEQERPNLFTNSVANIGPSEDVIVQIEYQQTLRYDQGTFSLRFPLVVAPRYIPGTPSDVSFEGGGWAWDTDQVSDASRITPPVQRPEEPGKLAVELAVDLQPGFPLSWVRSTSHDVDVVEGGDGSYAVQLSNQSAFASKDFVLEWLPAVGSAPGAGLFREEAGDENYLLLMVMPPNEAMEVTLPREVIFIVDTSGSMAGTSIEQAREALNMALQRLRPEDRFNVIEFNNHARRLFEAAMPADTSNRSRAQRWVSSLDADGGTNILAGLEMALEGGTDETRIRQVVFLTDGAVGNEHELFGFINDNLGDSRLFTVGIGSAPNSYFMRKASEFGHGTFTHIGSVDEVAERMTALFGKLESPVLTDIWVEFVGDCDAEVWPETVPDLYLGEPVIVAAQVDAGECVAEVSGNYQGAEWSTSLPVSGGMSGEGIGALWARYKIESSMDLFHQGASEDEVREQVLDVALRHHLVSKYTSLVAVDVTPTRPVGEELESESVAVNLPEGWDFDKVFGGEITVRENWSPPRDAFMDGTPTILGSVDDSTTLSHVPCGATCAPRRIAGGVFALLMAALLITGLRRIGR